MDIRYTVKRSTLTGALRVAAAQYQTDAHCQRTSGLPDPQRQRLVDAFSMQAKEANTIADEIEQADIIVLVD